MVVSGSLVEQALQEAPYAIGVVSRDELRASGPLINLSEALQRVPGIVVNNRSNFAQDLQISSRGFGARSAFGVRGLRIFTDGIPATGPDGQGQVSQFDLAGADRIEVLRGPFSALYGNSSGGVIALISAPIRHNEWRMETDVGSFGLRQSRLSAQAKSGALEWQGSVSHAELDGFRPQSGAVKQQAQARAVWRYAQGDWTLQFGRLNQPADDPLGLTAAQLAQNPRQSSSLAMQYDTRKDLTQSQVGASWRHRFVDGALREIQWSVYRGERAVSSFLAIAPGTQAAARHGGGMVDFTRAYQGSELRARWELGPVGVVAGLSWDRQVDDRQGYENFTGTGSGQVLGVQGRLRRDELNLATSRDAFGQAEWSLSPRLTAIAGVRAGSVDLEARDRFLNNGNDSGALQFAYTNPVVGLRWRVAPQWNAHLSVGRGFESPTLGELAYRADGTGGFNTALRPQTSGQWEAGLKWRPGGLDADLAVFDARTDDEIGVATNAGGRSAFQNVGRTLRRGAEASVAVRAEGGWSARMAASLLQATYRDSFLTCDSIPCTAPTARVAAGNRIAGAPRAWGYAEVQRRSAYWGAAAVEWKASSAVAVNDRNTESSRGYAVWSLRWTHQWALGDGWRLEALARVDNLLNRRYANTLIVNDANGRFYEPGIPRNALVGLRLASRF